MGVPLQAADQGRFILGGAGSCAGECMAGAWIKGETLNSGRSGGSSIHSKGHQYHQTGHGGDVRDTNIDTKDQKHEAQGSQKETTGCRGSDRHQTQQGRHQGQGQRKGEDTSLLCVEQQQWGLCWLTTRCRLPRKSSKSARVHQVWVGRSPFFSVPSEGKLIQDLQKDWKTRTLPRSRRQAEDDVNTAKVPTPPIWVWTRSRLSQKSPGDREGHEGKKEEKRDRRSRSRRRHSRRSQDKAEFNGKVMTLEVYLLKRRFFFLHLYSGPQDPLGGGFGEGCKEVQDEGDGGKL